MKPTKGLLLVLSGPSGTGKGTIVEQLLHEDSNLQLSISFTTREPREGEEEGKSYFFISKEEFATLLEEDAVLEYTEYNGNFYGTPKKNIEKWRKKAHDVILEIEVDGGKQIKKKTPDCVNLFLLPPSMKELDIRLHKRNTETDEVIAQRIALAHSEIKEAEYYDYIIINDKLEDTVKEIQSIIRAEKHRYSRSHEIIERVLNND